MAAVQIVTAFNEAHGRDPTEVCNSCGMWARFTRFTCCFLLLLQDEIKDILRKMQGQVVSDDAEVEAEDAAGSEPASKKQKK